MARGTHGEKIVAAIESEKLPANDKSRLEAALQKYDEWIVKLKSADAPTVDALVEELVNLLNEYKLYVDVDLIFDNFEDTFGVTIDEDERVYLDEKYRSVP